MHNKYKDKGFVLIATHRQGADLKDKCMALMRQHKANYTVTSNGSVAGDNSRGIPQAFLFDWNGKLVKEGHPSELYSEVDKLMARAPHWLTAGREFKNSDVQKAVSKLQKNKDFGKIVKSLEKVDGDGAEEAKFLKGRIEGYGEGLLSQAEEHVSTNPIAAQSEFKTVEKLFKGHDFGDKAKARLKELKKDKEFQTELKAYRYVAQMEALSGELKPQYKPDHPANRKTIMQIQMIAKKLMKKYPESKAAARAREVISGLPQ